MCRVIEQMSLTALKEYILTLFEKEVIFMEIISSRIISKMYLSVWRFQWMIPFK